MNSEELHALFKKSGRTLGSVESFTGGRFASSMTSIAGASSFYKGGYVTYATEEKEKLLYIDHDRIEQFGVVSQEICGDMAMHAKSLLNVDYCVAFTGNAGPTAMENKPVGEVYIGVTAYQMTQVYRYQLSGNREEVISQALNIAYKQLAIMLEQFK